MFTSFIPTLLGSGLQSSLARYMAEKSDEGQDARTTYFFLAGMFSPVFFWPLISIFTVCFLGQNIFSLIGGLAIILVILVFYLCSLIFLVGYDLWSDYKVAVAIGQLSKTESGKQLNILLENLNSKLGLLI
jgi:hypothetical protein